MKWTDTHVIFSDGYTITRGEALENLFWNTIGLLILAASFTALILGG